MVRWALERDPILRAIEAKRRSGYARAEASSERPPPEAMAQVWQVPLARPHRVDEAGMVMAGVQQTFAPAGVRRVMRDADRAEADAEALEGDVRKRELRRMVSHAFVDWVQAVELHHAHGDHQRIAEELASAARARQSVSGNIVELSEAEAEVEMIEADELADAERISAAQARLNSLLRRDVDAPLPDAVVEAPPSALPKNSEVVRGARERRPELAMARARRDTQALRIRSAEREARSPMTTLGAFYFAPTMPMKEHGYGVSVAMSLPWLGRSTSSRVSAERAEHSARSAEVEATRAELEVQAVEAAAMARASLRRLITLRDRSLPARKRTYAAALALYATGGTELADLLRLRRDLVELELELIATRADLEHAVVDLEWASGLVVPRERARPAAASPRRADSPSPNASQP
jgi:outer membrane protein TolC